MVLEQEPGEQEGSHEVCARLAWLAAPLPHSLPKRCAKTLLGSKALHNYCLFKLMTTLAYSAFYKKNVLSPLDSNGAKREMVRWQKKPENTAQRIPQQITLERGGKPL